MPVYDYRCSDCGREVEVTHGIHAAGPSTCSSCGGPMRKALSTPAIHFKGSGWAKKDARAAARPAPTDPGAKASATSGSPGGTTASSTGGADATSTTAPSAGGGAATASTDAK